MGVDSKARQVDVARVSSIHDADGAYDGTGDMIDMKNFDGCLVVVAPAAVAADATHHITGFKIVSNTTAAGAGTDHDIAEAVTTDGGTTKTLTQADMGTAATSGVHSQLMALDVRADQMYPGDRYICAVTASTGTYPCTILYFRYNGKFSYKDMIQATDAAPNTSVRTAFQYNGDL